MAFIGNNPQALFGLASRCVSGADLTKFRIELLRQVINTLRSSVWGNWVQPYIQMLQQVIEILQRVEAMLRQFATVLNQNAAEQQGASAVPGAASPTGGTSRPSSLTQALQRPSSLQDLIQAARNTLNGQPTQAATGQATTGLQPSAGGQLPAPTQSDVPAPGTPELSPGTPAAQQNDTYSGAGGDGSGSPPSSGGGTGGGGTDTGGSGPAGRPDQESGQPTVLGRASLGQQVGGHGAVLATAAGPESGAVSPETISLNDQSEELATGVVAGAAALGTAGGMWAGNRFGNQATDGETRTVTA